MTNEIGSSATLGDVEYEIRGQLAHRANDMERRRYVIISLNIGNSGLFSGRGDRRQ
ncbi:MAG: hypothetical protein QNI99_10180 [Woeseiaceae bacterium]|nr:hypothetical protein [Woeseiaceae bacterium]